MLPSQYKLNALVNYSFKFFLKRSNWNFKSFAHKHKYYENMNNAY